MPEKTKVENMDCHECRLRELRGDYVLHPFEGTDRQVWFVMDCVGKQFQWNARPVISARLQFRFQDLGLGWRPSTCGET
jgi:hypothetical protein